MSRLLAAAPSKHGRVAGKQPATRSHSGPLVSSDANELLANLGFLLVPGAPLDHGPSYLLIALRPRPTLAHFDPERIECWAVERGNAANAVLEWPLAPGSSAFSWGTIRIVDRLRAENRFISFGGTLTVSRDLDVHAALFRSDAPILALGGHSGSADPIAVHVAAFLARLRGAAGYDSPAKRAADELTPIGLYAAFLSKALEVYEGEQSVKTVSPRLISVFRSELHRLGRDYCAETVAGRELGTMLNAV
jgi:hypothetical protein